MAVLKATTVNGNLTVLASGQSYGVTLNVGGSGADLNVYPNWGAPTFLKLGTTENYGVVTLTNTSPISQESPVSHYAVIQFTQTATNSSTYPGTYLLFPNKGTSTDPKMIATEDIVPTNLKNGTGVGSLYQSGSGRSYGNPIAFGESSIALGQGRNPTGITYTGTIQNGVITGISNSVVSYQEGWIVKIVGNNNYYRIASVNSSSSITLNNTTIYPSATSISFELLQGGASGMGAMSTGLYNLAHGGSSFVTGSYNKSEYNNQTVVGKYNNNKSTTLFEVGNGTSDSAKSNAFEVNTDGTASLGTTTTLKPLTHGDYFKNIYNTATTPSYTTSTYGTYYFYPTSGITINEYDKLFNYMTGYNSSSLLVYASGYNYSSGYYQWGIHSGGYISVPGSSAYLTCIVLVYQNNNSSVPKLALGKHLGSVYLISSETSIGTTTISLSKSDSILSEIFGDKHVATIGNIIGSKRFMHNVHLSGVCSTSPGIYLQFSCQIINNSSSKINNVSALLPYLPPIDDGCLPATGTYTNGSCSTLFLISGLAMSGSYPYAVGKKLYSTSDVNGNRDITFLPNGNSSADEVIDVSAGGLLLASGTITIKDFVVTV